MPVTKSTVGNGTLRTASGSARMKLVGFVILESPKKCSASIRKIVLALCIRAKFEGSRGNWMGNGLLHRTRSACWWGRAIRMGIYKGYRAPCTEILAWKWNGGC